MILLILVPFAFVWIVASFIIDFAERTQEMARKEEAEELARAKQQWRSES